LFTSRRAYALLYAHLRVWHFACQPLPAIHSVNK
jgi:hypothetical protein